jgi:hypothetical protein
MPISTSLMCAWIVLQAGQFQVAIALCSNVERQRKSKMPKIAGDPLRKVTLNLYDADVQWFQDRYGQGYSEMIRTLVHQHVTRTQSNERAVHVQRNRQVNDT